jgi:hypothetical protein
MTLKSSRAHRWTAAFAVGLCLLASTGISEAISPKEPIPAVPNSEVRGKVVSADGKAVSGVEVLGYHLATEEIYRATTDGKGHFSMTELPYGYYDLAVLGSDGLFVSDQVANVSPTGKNVVEFRLQPFGETTQSDRRAFPGNDQTPIGIARVEDQRMVGESFWSSPKGISILSGGGALILLAIAGSSSESNASPFIP